MGSLFDVSSGRPVNPSETHRSGLGKLLSDKMPGILSGSLGDIGIRYDRLSRTQKVGTLLGMLAVLGGGLFVGARAVESAFDLSGDNVVAYQEQHVVGPHALVSFTNTNPDRNIWGYPNTDKNNPTFGRVPVGAEVVCAPVVEGMAFVQSQDGAKGFVSFDGKGLSANPEGCPDNAAVVYDPKKDPLRPFSLVTATGEPVNFPLGEIKES